MTAPTVKGASPFDAGQDAPADAREARDRGHSPARDPDHPSAQGTGGAGAVGSPFSFEVHPAWTSDRGGRSRTAQDATSLRKWVSDTVLSAPGARAPWLDLEGARVDPARLAGLTPRPTLVLGMGGSALGTRAALSWAAADGEVPFPVRVLDTVDPEVVREHLAWRDQFDARVVVVSKSGTTIEVHRLLDVLFERGLRSAVFVADPVRTSMDERFSERGCVIDRFDMPADVGGRYSVLTAVGQVPLQCAGLDPHALLDGAAELRAAWRVEAHAESNGERSVSNAGDLDALTRSIEFRLSHPAAVNVMWCYAERLLPYAAWLQQLDNESLGRRRAPGDHVGEIILALRGPADQHSVAQLVLDGPRDKRVLFVDRRVADIGGCGPSGLLLGGTAGRARHETSDPPAVAAMVDESVQRLESLRAAEAQAAFEAVGEVHATARFVMPGTGLAALGAAFLRAMLEVVALGWAMGIDPYGQPAVEAIKRRIREG